MSNRKLNRQIFAFALIGMLSACAQLKQAMETTQSSTPPVVTQAAPVPVEEPVVSAKEMKFATYYRVMFPDSGPRLTCSHQCQENHNICQSASDNTTLDDPDICQQEYHTCLRLCGVRVSRYTKCVENC